MESYLCDHSVGRLESSSPDDVSDLGAVDFAIEFLVVEVEDLFQLV